MTRLKLACLVATLVLAGCADPPSPYIRAAFFDTDFQSWQRSGSSAISGQAFLKLPNGRAISCAGETVALLPATGYNMELEDVLQEGHGYPVNYDRRERKYEHKVECDGAGRFVFDGLPVANWIVVTRVTWQEPSSIPFMSPHGKGGWFFQEIQTGERPVKILLTNQDFVEDKP